jgi:hypothetical protein
MASPKKMGKLCPLPRLGWGQNELVFAGNPELHGSHPLSLHSPVLYVSFKLLCAPGLPGTFLGREPEVGPEICLSTALK